MNKLLITAVMLMSAGTGFAEPMIKEAPGNDGSGALILLALVGLVVAAGRMAPAKQSEPDPLLLSVDSEDE